ncbi:YCF48-related protein [Magnetospirillum sp. 15-1]|uniref:WD40/YVTN/BNR-like repeat-containing protein n=1 Tax=Magnetospirillum sp. 15-1 TaxID=1979370 RepID=UPI0018D54012|nr:YCF48-related protein [Magnetospirillum sp. 15-1]
MLSDDNGKNWRQAPTPVSVTLTGVHFPSKTHGWAVGHGGVILASTDGGETWTKQFDGRKAAEIEFTAAKASQAEHRLAEAERLIGDGPDKPFLDVHFMNEKDGLAVGAYGLAFATSDGGASWRSIMGKINNPTSKHLVSILTNERGIYLAGEQGLFFHSTDGGASFAEIPSPTRGTFFGMVGTSAGDVVVFGLRGNAYLRLQTGEWKKIAISGASLVAGQRLTDNSVVLIDEFGSVLRSIDGGHTFAVVVGPQAMSLASLVQAPDGTLVGAGGRGNLRLTIALDKRSN